jgi:hypothetical protein
MVRIHIRCSQRHPSETHAKAPPAELKSACCTVVIRLIKLSSRIYIAASCCYFVIENIIALRTCDGLIVRTVLFAQKPVITVYAYTVANVVTAP